MRVAVIALGAALCGAAIYWIASLFHPPLLLFPYSRTVGATRVYSDTPIPDEIEEVIGRADALVRASPIFAPEVLGRRVYLTDGGLRWRLLTFNSGAFAQSRPMVETIVVNRASIVADRVWKGPGVDEVRDLSGVIAHERTHTLIRRRYGLLADRLHPTWVREGYCDYVAGSSTLSDEAAARLVAEGRRTPALVYYESRKRVERELAANGGSVDDLFRSSPGRGD